MTKNNVLKFDVGRRQRRMAQRAQEAAAERVVAQAQHLIDSGLIARAHQALADVAADGLPSQSMGEHGATGDHGDPTASAAVGNDHLAAKAKEAHLELERAESAIVHAFRLFTQLAGMTVAPTAADPAGSGNCQRCGRWVSGSQSDRIRSGWCMACYQAWRRADTPDRSEFNATSDDENPA